MTARLDPAHAAEIAADVLANMKVNVVGTVTTRGRSLTMHDVFLTVGDDDPLLLGQITRHGRDWGCGGLIYGHRQGAAMDRARRTLTAGDTPYSGLYGTTTTPAVDRRLSLVWKG